MPPSSEPAPKHRIWRKSDLRDRGRQGALRLGLFIIMALEDSGIWVVMYASLLLVDRMAVWYPVSNWGAEWLLNIHAMAVVVSFGILGFMMIVDIIELRSGPEDEGNTPPVSAPMESHE